MEKLKFVADVLIILGLDNIFITPMYLHLFAQNSLFHRGLMQFHKLFVGIVINNNFVAFKRLLKKFITETHSVKFNGMNFINPLLQYTFHKVIVLKKEI